MNEFCDEEYNSEQECKNWVAEDESFSFQIQKTHSPR